MKKWQDKTRGGYRYTLARDENGEVMVSANGYMSGHVLTDILIIWDANGKAVAACNLKRHTEFDLVPAEPERREVVRWVAGDKVFWSSKTAAKPDANGNVAKVTIAFEDDRIVGSTVEVVKAEGA